MFLSFLVSFNVTIAPCLAAAITNPTDCLKLKYWTVSFFKVRFETGFSTSVVFVWTYESRTFTNVCKITYAALSVRDWLVISSCR